MTINEGLTSLTAVRPIEKGEEIVMNYGPNFQDWLDKVTEIQNQHEVRKLRAD